MVGRTAPILKADRRRFRLIREIGCVPCHMDGRPGEPCEINHLLNGYRIGHQATVGECPHHHRGIPKDGINVGDMQRWFGPSRALHKRVFHCRYGTDAALLAEQNRLIERELEFKV